MTGKQRYRKVIAAAVSVFTLIHVFPNSTATAEYIIPTMPDFSYIGPIGKLTSEQTRKAAETVYDAIYFHKNDIDFKTCGIRMTPENSDSLISIYRHVAACYDVGLLVKKGTISYIPSSSIINLSYLYSGNEYEKMYMEYSAKLDDILSGVDYSWSDVEKALYLHDYISVRFDYDYPAYNGEVTRQNREQYSSYGMLKNGMAVCEGYSELYAKLMNRLGIHTELVTSDEMKHAWNMVSINGSMYYVDVAWDDSFYGYSGIVKHTNFLRTGREMRKENHDCTDWKDAFGHSLYDMEVPDTYSSAFWLDSRAAIKPYENGWAAIVGTPSDLRAEIYDYDPVKKEWNAEKCLTAIPSSLATWYVWGNPYSYWTESFTMPEVINGIFYYSTPSAIYSYCGGRNIKVYELSEDEKKTGYIYGMYFDGENMYYGLDTEYHHVGKGATVPIKYSSAAISDLEERIRAEADIHADTTTENAAVTTSATPAGKSVTTHKSETTVTRRTVAAMVSTDAAPPVTTSAITKLPVMVRKSGDVDNDGMINAVDASVILSYYASTSTGGNDGFDSGQRKAADVNKDGVIDAVDASGILSYYAFLSTHTQTLNIDEFIDKRRTR